MRYNLPNIKKYRDDTKGSKMLDNLEAEIFRALGEPINGGKVNRYPLTDISIDKDENVFIDIAVAGFGPNDIDIEMTGDTLVITGSKEIPDSDREYIQSFISTSDFERKIKLGEDHISGDIEASYNDGILSIKVTKAEIPKKLIPIRY